MEIDTRRSLDGFACSIPVCDHKHGGVFHVVPPCHRASGLIVTYDQADGVLTLACHRCKKLVAWIEVAA